MENKENLKENIKEPVSKKPDTNYKTLFSDARSCTVKILCRCERTDSYLDKLIDAEIKKNVLNDFDKSLLNEMAHGVIRWKRRLDWFLNGFYRGQYEKTLPEVKNALRVALYQILFLNKIPYSAAVNEAVEFIKKIHGDKHAAVVNGLLRTIIRTLDSLVWPTREIDEVNYLGIIQSHPNWMVRRWINRFGFDDAEKLCEANNRRPFLSLRANSLMITPDELAEHLKSRKINYRVSEHLDGYFSIKIMSKIYADEFFKKGYFSVQDVSAGFMARLLSPGENDYILDACAAPGGKTSQMAELMNNKGNILAVDKYLSRVETMNENLKRLGIENTKTLHDDINDSQSPELSEEMVGKFDKILLDVPCSGLGVLSKKPDIKWKRELEDIKKLQILQAEILENTVKYLKPGGVLVYSTCTTENEENADIVNAFLENHPEFKIDNAKNYVPENVVNEQGFIETFPHIHGIDGAFGARLIKTS
ncbi:MAG: 16S rRNA (cytosine(967)-C(5))-methyltransferase RsmB [Ignavibacteriae bacterium]|nr:16S rRNA (cytosine(967)-C(5))-methyltransferase RsmB [Ignavibacteriota bacterium]MCB9242222.1 16S rRNA (cytosine(967)-C(5))-methyltransferase RsmB [Ignavibacteriales bacterium]